jgi:hypothetical protein
MWEWVDRLVPTLFDASLAAAVLTGAVALGMVACRQPARRCVLARAGLLGALVVWPLMSGIGPARLRLDVLRPMGTVAAPFLGVWPEPPPGTGALGSAGGSSLAGNLTSWLARFRPGPSRGLTLLYAAGAGVGIAWLALGWLFSAWLSGHAGAPSDGTHSLYKAVPFAGWRWRRPRLKVAERVGRPVLLGVVQPAILIPPELDRPESGEHLRLSLLHELAHAERGDAWFSLAGSLAQATWFFLPWVWWMRVQMRLDQEFLADHRASHGFGPFGTYASSLVALADPGPVLTGAGPARPLLTVAGPGGRGGATAGASSALWKRVLMLVRCPYPVEASAPLWWRFLLPLVVACGTLAASSLTLKSALPTSLPLLAPGGASVPKNDFRLARLVIAEGRAGADGFTAPHNLPARLPERFELSLEIWADLTDLAQTRVAGVRVGPELPEESTGWDFPRWRKVFIQRDHKGLTIRVDDQPLAPDPRDTKGSAWLSVQPPPERLGLFRNLVLTW